MKIVQNMLNTPLSKAIIRNTNGLQNLSILRNPRGTNFPVTQDEWQIIIGLIK